MLSRFWQWLSRLWRRPQLEPPASPEVTQLLEAATQQLNDWALHKLRNDIIASLRDEFPVADEQQPKH